MPFPSLDRRKFLALTGGTLGAAVSSQLLGTPTTAEAAELDAAPFTLGVASGEPDHESVVLWTRLRRPFRRGDRRHAGGARHRALGTGP